MMDDVRARLSAYRKSKEQSQTATQIQPLRPNILWAQRSDTLLLTVNLNDIRDETFSFEENTFKFGGVGGNEQRRYEVEMEFYKEILPQKFKHNKTDRGIFFEIEKKSRGGPYWPRLLSDPQECLYVQVDFSKWKEEGEDESDSGPKSAQKQSKTHVSVKQDIPPPISPRPWYITALYILLWLLLWGFFVEIEFGVVFVILSAFTFIVLSLRGSRRRIGELSAYSVFNENCESLQGTLTAEQFERELRYGPTSVR